MREPECQNDREGGALGDPACGAAFVGKNGAHDLRITGKAQNASQSRHTSHSVAPRFSHSGLPEGNGGGGACLHCCARRLSLAAIVHARSPETPMISLK